MSEYLITARPRRSALYIPGSNARALEKAKILNADILLLDLEDAAAPEKRTRRATWSPRLLPGAAMASVR